MIQLEYYRIFEAVARNGSISLAAQELFITQPAVSQTVQRLERELGCQLFTRSARGVTLTQAGAVLHSYASQALSLITGAENHISSLQSLALGTLTIGASDTLCRHYLLPFLQQFHETYPHVNVRVTNRTSGETVELLKHGRVDLGFINMPTETGAAMTVQPLLPLHDILVYNPLHFPDIAQGVSLSDLPAPLLMLEQESSTRRYWDACLLRQGITLKPQIELGSHDLLLSFAQIGLGVAAVVREYATRYLEDGTLKELKIREEMPPRSIGLIYPSKLPLTHAAGAFVRLIGGAS